MWKLLLPVCIAVTTAVIIDHQYPEKTKYSFFYFVDDPLTSDWKNQWEQRKGDTVQGSYRLAEADGTIRIVDYYADGKNGFRAIFRREGQTHHQLAVPTESYQNAIPVQPIPTSKRDYYGATFVQQNNYGRGLGYL